MKYYKKDWSTEDFNKVKNALTAYFSGKLLVNHRDESVKMPYSFEKIEMILGLPYTSTSMCPMMGLDCNVHFKVPRNTDYHYSHVVLDDMKNVVLIAWNKDEHEIFIAI